MCILQEQAFDWVNLSPFHLKYRIALDHLGCSQALRGPSQHMAASGLGINQLWLEGYVYVTSHL